MTQIRKEQARLYLWLKKALVQHAAFGVIVFLLTFSFLALHAWYQGRGSLLDGMSYQREAVWVVLKDALIYTLLMAVPVYVNLAYVYTGRLQKSLYPAFFSNPRMKGWFFYQFFGFSLLTALAFSLLYAPLMARVIVLIDQTWYQLTPIILFMLITTAGVTYSKDAVETHRERDRLERQEATRKRREAERQLQFIKKQIRPHFLFNTLANLQILAQQQAPELPELIGELSRLLRYLVYQTNERYVPLAEELDFIESYLNLQRLQIGQDTELVYTQEGTVSPAHCIAPMILLLFVENCFKHYNRKHKSQKFIRIAITVQDQHLRAQIENSYKPNAQNEDNFKPQKQGHGVGLSSAIENLQLVYAGRYELQQQAEDGVYTVTLNLPI